MTTQTHSFTLKRGDTFKQKIVVSENGNPVDITGWTIYFTVKRKKTDSDLEAIIKKDITVHTDPTAGESVLLVLPEETRPLSGQYYWDLQVKRPITEPQVYDDISTILEGSITWTEWITQRHNGAE